MSRARTYALALLGMSVGATALCACIDTRLSLGHHQSAGGASGMEPSVTPPVAPPPVVDASVVEPPEQDSSTAPELDASLPGRRACDDGLLAAELQCAIDSGFIGPPGARPPPPMSASSSLSVQALPARPGHARVTGPLSFEAWGASFNARIEGELDCGDGSLRATLVDATHTSFGVPPEPFFGMLHALLDPSTLALTGTWWHGPSINGGPRCTGPWSATRLP